MRSTRSRVGGTTGSPSVTPLSNQASNSSGVVMTAGVMLYPRPVFANDASRALCVRPDALEVSESCPGWVTLAVKGSATMYALIVPDPSLDGARKSAPIRPQRGRRAGPERHAGAPGQAVENIFL